MTTAAEGPLTYCKAIIPTAALVKPLIFHRKLESPVRLCYKGASLKSGVAQSEEHSHRGEDGGSKPPPAS